jgi:hypothetical protein
VESGLDADHGVVDEAAAIAGHLRSFMPSPSRHLDDHFGLGVALFQVGDRCRELGEPIAPVDPWA